MVDHDRRRQPRRRRRIESRRRDYRRRRQAGQPRRSISNAPCWARHRPGHQHHGAAKQPAGQRESGAGRAAAKNRRADPSWELLGLETAADSADSSSSSTNRAIAADLSVAAVRPDSPAAKQGIRRGDVLVGMHIWETMTLENVDYVLNRPDFADFSAGEVLHPPRQRNALRPSAGVGAAP